MTSKSKADWDETIRHSNDFFIKNGWDEKSGSFASDLTNEGARIDNKRYLIASSRMAYGLAHGADVNPDYLKKAQQQVDFILTKMTGRDKNGLPYFKNCVDEKGNETEPQEKLAANEQAYGLNGLVALYSKTKDPALLDRIEESYDAFYQRFHDPVSHGFFDGFDVRTQTPIKTKSYNSTVYVATSFLIELAKLDTPRKEEYVAVLKELLDVVATRFPDAKTGWITENFTQDWKPDWRDWQKQLVKLGERKQDFTIGVAGHNYQAAWLLMRGTEFSEIDAASKKLYLDSAKSILTSMLNSKALDKKRGGIFDSFRREDGQPMWNENKAWWQQAEAIMAMTKASSLALFDKTPLTQEIVKQRDKAVDFYFSKFIDRVNGGEFPVVQADGTPVTAEAKGGLGTGSYHQVELARMMKEYASQAPASVPKRQKSRMARPRQA